MRWIQTALIDCCRFLIDEQKKRSKKAWVWVRNHIIENYGRQMQFFFRFQIYCDIYIIDFHNFTTLPLSPWLSFNIYIEWVQSICCWGSSIYILSSLAHRIRAVRIPNNILRRKEKCCVVRWMVYLCIEFPGNNFCGILVDCCNGRLNTEPDCKQD